MCGHKFISDQVRWVRGVENKRERERERESFENGVALSCVLRVGNAVLRIKEEGN